MNRADVSRTATDAYRLDAPRRDHLRDAIKAAMLAAMLATYRQAQRTVRSPSPAWQPSPSLESAIAAQAAQAAEGIAATFSADVSRYVDSYLVSVEDAGAPGGWRTAIAGLVNGVRAWLRDHLAWKGPQVVNATCGAGVDMGTEAFCDDYTAGEVLLGDDVDPQYLVVDVWPEEASNDLCQQFAGNSYPIEEYQLVPDFPIHPNCRHQKIVQYIGP